MFFSVFFLHQTTFSIQTPNLFVISPKFNSELMLVTCKFSVREKLPNKSPYANNTARTTNAWRTRSHYILTTWSFSCMHCIQHSTYTQSLCLTVQIYVLHAAHFWCHTMRIFDNCNCIGSNIPIWGVGNPHPRALKVRNNSFIHTIFKPSKTRRSRNKYYELDSKTRMSNKPIIDR